MALITYADKSTMNENASVPAVNKVQASDMNEIKNVVNNNWNALADHVIELGTNYIKYDSGIMVQWGKATVTAALQTSNGALYRTSSVASATFPQPFIDNNAVITLTPHAALAVAYLGNITTTSFEFWPNTLVSSGAATRYVSWQAIGRWDNA